MAPSYVSYYIICVVKIYRKRIRMDKFKLVLRKITTRQAVANVLMSSFILFTAIGTFLINPALGFIVFGLAAGAVGYLLGME